MRERFLEIYLLVILLVFFTTVLLNKKKHYKDLNIKSFQVFLLKGGYFYYNHFTPSWWLIVSYL